MGLCMSLYCRQMLFCRVTLGKSFLQFSAMKMAHAPPGHHSVIGRPSVNGLAYAEYVIYRGEQVSKNISSLVSSHACTHLYETETPPSLTLFHRLTQSTWSPTRSWSQRLRPHLLLRLSRSPRPIHSWSINAEQCSGLELFFMRSRAQLEGLLKIIPRIKLPELSVWWPSTSRSRMILRNECGHATTEEEKENEEAGSWLLGCGAFAVQSSRRQKSNKSETFAVNYGVYERK